MKERLGAILVGEGLITPEQRDQALESQILSGGRLGTNLVDMKLLTVDQVGKYLSVQHNLPIASYDDLFNTPEDVVQQVSKAHCARYKVFPLDIHDKVLHLAMLDPDDLVAQDELTFLLDVRIQPYVVPQLRLLQVLEKRHGFMRERRFLRIPDEGEGTLPPVHFASPPRRGRISALVPAVKVPKAKTKKPPFKQVKTLLNTPVPASGEPMPATQVATPEARKKARARADGTRDEQKRPVTLELTAPADDDVTAVAPGSVSTPSAADDESGELVFLDSFTRKKPTARAAKQAVIDDDIDDDINVVVELPEEEELPDEEDTQIDQLGDAETAVVSVEKVAEVTADEGATVVLHEPLNLGGIKAAATAMEAVTDRDAIIEMLVHPFRYQPVLAVLFLVRGEMAVGLAASETELSDEEVRGLVLPLATPSLLKEAHSRKEIVLGTTKEDPLQQVIARYLRWEDPEEVCIAPINHGDRVINLLCIQTKRGTRFPDGFLAELTTLCDKAAESYIRLIHRHKRPASAAHQAIVKKKKTSKPVGSPEKPKLSDNRFFITGYITDDQQGTVWRAIDTRRQKVVAVRVLPDGALRPDQIKRLQRMVVVLNELRHQRILMPLSAGNLPDGRPFLVTELVESGSLRDRLERKPTPPKIEVAEIIRQVAEALHATHCRKMFHGDVRPENVLFPVQNKLALKLGGFGLPRGIPAGLPRPDTAQYMAPEGIGGPGGSASADVYALAAMAWEMLGGELPFAGDSVLAPPELPPLLPGVPHQALHVLMRGLAQLPEQRPSAAELAMDLFKAIRDASTE